MNISLSLLAFVMVCYQIATACQGTGTEQDQFYVNCLRMEGATFGVTQISHGITDLGITVKSLQFKVSLFQIPKYIFFPIWNIFEENLDVS